jgi:predicted transcriptional regulator
MVYNINDLDFRTNKSSVIEKLVRIRFSEIDTVICLEFNKLPRFLKKLLAKVNITDQESVSQYRMKTVDARKTFADVPSGVSVALSIFGEYIICLNCLLEYMQTNHYLLMPVSIHLLL